MVKKKKIVSTILTTPLVFLAGLVVFVLWPLIMLFARLLDSSEKAPNTISRWGLSFLSFVSGVRLTVEGRENLDKKQQYLILANHKSSVDILVLARILPLHFKFFAYSRFFSIPFFGWGMALAGYIPVNRSSRVKSYKAIQKGINILSRNQASLLIFPEGARIEEHHIKRFKHGFLWIATKSQKPLLPVVLEGTLEIKKRIVPLFHPGRVRVSILPPVPTIGLTKDKWPQLRQKLEKQFQEEYARLLTLRSD
jgi:1-acyl-sn-glycerol-3-phosphate acyltransferase